MTIQQTIRMLHASASNGALLQRSFSTSTGVIPPLGMLLPPTPTPCTTFHSPLCRVQSAPLERQPTEESTDGEEEMTETDQLAWSYNAGELSFIIQSKDVPVSNRK